jgi:hypothetical protein
MAMGAHAQTAAPAKPNARPDVKTDAKADPKAGEAAAAMERAKRQAAGPLRVILEASKGRRRDAEPASQASDASSVRTVAARAAPELAMRSAPVPPAIAAEPTTAPVPSLRVSAPAPPPAAQPVTTQMTLSSESLQSHHVAAVPALDRSNAPMLPAVPVAPLLSAKMMEVGVKPKLVSRVDPDVPQRLLDDLGRNAVVAVDLTIRANGTVAGVGMVTSVQPRMQRALASALEQWRFEPLPSDRVHRIELLFNSE